MREVQREMCLATNHSEEIGNGWMMLCSAPYKENEAGRKGVNYAEYSDGTGCEASKRGNC